MKKKSIFLGIILLISLQKSFAQEKIMREVMQTPNIESIWESEEIEKLVLSRL